MSLVPWLSRRPSNTNASSLGLAPLPAATLHPRSPPWNMSPHWFPSSKHWMAPAGEETWEVWSWLCWVSLYPNLPSLPNCTWQPGMLPNESMNGSHRVLPSCAPSPAPGEKRAIPSFLLRLQKGHLSSREPALLPSLTSRKRHLWEEMDSSQGA